MPEPGSPNGNPPGVGWKARLGDRIRRRPDRVAWVVVCLVLWPIPLLNRLHVESSAVLALAAWFIAGYAALAAFSGGTSFRRVLVERLDGAAIALGAMIVPVLWAPNCGILDGLVYFGLFVPPTVVLAVSAAWAQVGLRHVGAAPRSSVRRMFARHAALGILIAIAGPIFDLGFHPQFYTYNHVFGAVVGPVYDEELVWRWGLPAFRGMTLVWAILLWSVGSAARARVTGDLRARRAVVLTAGLAGLVLWAAYANGDRLGINTSRAQLEAAMPVSIERGSLRLHGDSLDDRTVDFAAFTAHRLEEMLGVRPDRLVDVWIYPDAEVRARLTGARVTSVAPVWLPDPQVHVVADQFDDLFPHELVHAYAREFGMPILRASPAVGLVEGLAVALEPPDGRPSPDDLVASVLTASPGSPERTRDPGADLAKALTPWGFWTGRGGVSYTVTGSFVRRLVGRFGPEPIRNAYRSGDIESAYGWSIEELVNEWEGALAGLASLPADAGGRARTRFGAPSLLEKRCPHWVPRPERRRRAALEAWARVDTLRALAEVDRALADRESDPAILTTWVQLHMLAARFDAVAARIGMLPDSLRRGGIAVAEADLAALRGDSTTARRLYERVRLSLPVSSRETRALLVGRGLLAGVPGAAIELGRENGSVALLVAMVDSLARAPLDSVSAGAAGEWNRRRLAWQADEAYGRGDLAAAQAFAEWAGVEARRVGDFTGARWMDDFSERLRWLASEPD